MVRAKAAIKRWQEAKARKFCARVSEGGEAVCTQDRWTAYADRSRGPGRRRERMEGP